MQTHSNKKKGFVFYVGTLSDLHFLQNIVFSHRNGDYGLYSEMGYLCTELLTGRFKKHNVRSSHLYVMLRRVGTISHNS